MSTTTNLGLNKHENPSTNMNKFDVENYLNANWDIIDEYCVELKTTVDGHETKLNNNTTNITTNTTDISTLKSTVNTNTTNIAKNTSNITANTTKIANREPLHTYYRYDITEDIAEDTVIDLDFEYEDLVVLFCGERLIKDVEYEETSSTSITLLFNISYIEDYDKYIDFIVKYVDEEDSDE